MLWASLTPNVFATYHVCRMKKLDYLEEWQAAEFCTEFVQKKQENYVVKGLKRIDKWFESNTDLASRAVTVLKHTERSAVYNLSFNKISWTINQYQLINQ